MYTTEERKKARRVIKRGFAWAQYKFDVENPNLRTHFLKHFDDVITWCLYWAPYLQKFDTWDKVDDHLEHASFRPIFIEEFQEILASCGKKRKQKHLKRFKKFVFTLSEMKK